MKNVRNGSANITSATTKRTTTANDCVQPNIAKTILMLIRPPQWRGALGTKIAFLKCDVTGEPLMSRRAVNIGKHIARKMPKR